MLCPSRWHRPPSFRNSWLCLWRCRAEAHATEMKCALGCCLSADVSERLRLTGPHSSVCQRGTRTAEQKEQMAYTCRAGRRVRRLRGVSGTRRGSRVQMMNSENKPELKKDEGAHLETTLGTRDLREGCTLVQLPAGASISSEVPLPDTQPRDSVLTQNYWQDVSFIILFRVQRQMALIVAYCTPWPSPSKSDQLFVQTFIYILLTS